MLAVKTNTPMAEEGRAWRRYDGRDKTDDQKRREQNNS
jgi:hypothetical protein